MTNPFFRQTLDEQAAPYPEEEEEGVLAETAVSIPYEEEPGPVMKPLSTQTFGFNEDPDIQAQKLYDEADDQFFSSMKEVENGIRAGYNEQTGLWKPHESVEGGTDTLGYGHKLTPREQKGGFVTIDGERVEIGDGLTDEQVERLFQQDIAKVERQLEKNIEGYEDLPDKYQKVLINLGFNIGAGKVNNKGWPKLFKAMKEGDDETVRKEMITSYKTPSGERKKLINRARTIADSVGLGNKPNYAGGITAQ